MHTHRTTNTHNVTTTIHTANQQQLHTRQLKTSNNTRETNYNTTCTEGKNTQARQYCVQFLVRVAVDIFNKQSWTADKKWSSGLWVGRGAGLINVKPNDDRKHFAMPGT